MNPLHANFSELFERHLCRHSQFGINVIHLASVLGTYWALYSCAFVLLGTIAPLVALAAIYLGVLALNAPVRVFLVTLTFVGLFFGFVLYLPPLPFWVYPLTLYPFYKVQAWSHLLYSRATDMTAFNKKYPKGFALFILLTVYELPILLNYLVFDPRDVAIPAGPAVASAPEGVAQGAEV
jgi:hypothetical protein